MGDLVPALLARLTADEAAGLRLGTLTAIDTTDGSVTVDVAGASVPGMRWVGSYTPTVGDMVVVSRVDAMWVVLGKLSKQLGAPSVRYGTVTLQPVTAWSGVFAEDVWTWAVAPTAGVFGGPPGQGRRTVYTVTERHAGVWRLPNPTSLLPGGATVTGARLWITRWTPNAEMAQMFPEGSLVTPRLYRHAYTAQPVAAPTWSGAVWSPGTVAVGSSASWELPSAWLTDLLSGAAAGVGVYSTAAADWTRWASLRVDVSYTEPA